MKQIHALRYVDSRLTGVIFGQLGAAPQAKRLYAGLMKTAEFTSTQAWEALDPTAFDGLLLPGGHAPGMRQYLGSALLRDQVARFWALGRPVRAICHGVLVLPRTRLRPGRGQSSPGLPTQPIPPRTHRACRARHRHRRQTILHRDRS